MQKKWAEGIQKKKENLLSWSIRTALRQQNLDDTKNQISEIVPDIQNQYSSFCLENDYLLTKVRGQHAFQVSLFREVLRLLPLDTNQSIRVVDIGDSSGTHLMYIKRLFSDRNIHGLSVNIDPEAVRRIKERGLDAVCLDAEELDEKSSEADIFLCFEVLEHLMNPVEFLYKLSKKTECKALILTVPYVKNSRIGLHHIRRNDDRNVNPENTHIFELSPQDLKLMFNHAGWSILYEKIYFQYPNIPIIKILLKKYWKERDFEGFYGVILARDHKWSAKYVGW